MHKVEGSGVRHVQSSASKVRYVQSFWGAMCTAYRVYGSAVRYMQSAGFGGCAMHIVQGSGVFYRLTISHLGLRALCLPHVLLNH